MRRAWIANALLAASWLFALGLYGRPQLPAWTILFAVGTLLLARGDTAVTRTLAVLMSQGVSLLVYGWCTSYSHELPAILARLLCGIATALGIEATYNGADLALSTIRATHLLAPTWELLADPASVAFLAGGLALLAIERRPRPVRAALGLLLLVLLWLPLRAALLIGLFVHRALLTDYEAPFNLMPQFWSPWLMAALLAGPVLMATRLLPETSPTAPPPAPLQLRRVAPALLLLALAAACCTTAVLWAPVGRPAAGRVLVDEYHSTWEPTQRPFDTTWYGQKAGYNYACIYDYASRYFTMDRLTNRLDLAALENCDVLMLKVPTSPYEPDEVHSVVRFVERGGGLLLVGEHTDVFLTGSHLNQVARQFGFEFRSDCLFSIDGKFEQRFSPSVVPHPVIQHMPPIDMEVSCTIAPRRAGRAVMRATGMWNLPADYHASNFYPQLDDRGDARYGAFIQLWSTRRGQGRVLAFADSTVFSNFSAFEPGKSELMLGMLDWLNRRDRLPDPRLPFALAGLALLVAGVFTARRTLVPLAPALVSLLIGVAVAGALIRAHHAHHMPVLKPLRPFTRVVIDRTVSTAPVSHAGFIKSSVEGFGIFDQWILRLGYFTARHAGRNAFTGDLLVIFTPDRMPDAAYARGLARYVKDGGKLLVLESAVNTNSAANALLAPFALSIDPTSRVSGDLAPVPNWPRVPVDDALAVRGGTVLARVNDTPVAALARHGRGSVVLIGFGGRFSDDRMGVSTELEPTPELRQVYELEFALLRAIVENTLPETK